MYYMHYVPCIMRYTLLYTMLYYFILYNIHYTAAQVGGLSFALAVDAALYTMYCALYNTLYYCYTALYYTIYRWGVQVLHLW